MMWANDEQAAILRTVREKESQYGIHKKEWKLIIIVFLVLAVSVGMLYVSRDAVVMEVVGENVPVVEPHRAIIAAIIMMVVGLGIYLLRRKSYPTE